MFIITLKLIQITAVEAMKKVGMKSNTFYRRVKEYEYTLQKSTRS